MTIEQIRERGLIIYECISGSRAYNLHTERSDTDIRGIFILPKREYYGLQYIPQINADNNNVTFYEIGQFVQLLSKNNPNIIELMGTPDDCVVLRNPLLDLLTPDLFLSKLCRQTFAGYAMTQIKKAAGLNKKIMKPMEEQKKGVLDFCFVLVGYGSIPMREWLTKNTFNQEACGLVAVPHFRDIYGIFYDPSADGSLGYKGIVRSETSNDVTLSSIPKTEHPVGIMSFAKDGYSRYCKEYTEYFQWVKNRNEDRYRDTMEHGKNYDAKNMMHVFRLLSMAEEIATQKSINTKRGDREYLLKIRSGDFTYEELVARANDKMEQIDECYRNSDLQEMPDVDSLENALVQIRQSLYESVI